VPLGTEVCFFRPGGERLHPAGWVIAPPYHLLCYRCEDLAVRGIFLIDCAYHSIRVIQSTRVHMEQPRQRQQRRISFHQR
jgi:hypothetical protein